MNELIELLEKALTETNRVRVLGIWDREHLDRAVGYVKDAVGKLHERYETLKEEV
jgi:hypothetical protein